VNTPRSSGIEGDAEGEPLQTPGREGAEGGAEGEPVRGAGDSTHGWYRPSWDEYFLQLATQAASRSTCLRRQVGAVLVRDKRILATGYNGAPRGVSHCLDIGCLREQMGIPSGERQELCRAIHAEQNAVIQAAIHGVAIEGATLYTTLHPCVLCAKILINCGVREIHYVEGYPDELSRELLAEAGVVLIKEELPSTGR
jgi:dCMP deaminase